MEARREVFGVEPICWAVGVPVSTYYARRSRKPSHRAIEDEKLVEQIYAAREGYRAVYGVRKTWKELRRRDVEVGRDHVARLIRQEGLEGVRRGKKRRTTIVDEAALERARDLLQRDFVAARPNEKWVADITYIRTWNGFVYLAFVLDCYSRMIVGWQLATHLRTDLVLDALEMANGLRRPAPGLIAHTDQLSPGSTRASATPTASTRSAPHLRSAQGATPTTTRWPKHGSRPIRASSSTAAASRPLSTLSTRRCTGSASTTTSGCTKNSVTCRRPSMSS